MSESSVALNCGLLSELMALPTPSWWGRSCPLPRSLPLTSMSLHARCSSCTLSYARNSASRDICKRPRFAESPQRCRMLSITVGKDKDELLLLLLLLLPLKCTSYSDTVSVALQKIVHTSVGPLSVVVASSIVKLVSFVS